MVRITGIISELENINHCHLRVKASSPWIGVGTDVRAFEVKKGTLDIELPPTPKDRVWQISVADNKDAPFISTETWVVPQEDCTITEIRNFSLDYLKRLEQEVRLKQDQTEYIKRLEEEIQSLKRELSVKKRQLDICNSVSQVLLNDYDERVSGSANDNRKNLAEIAADNLERLG